MSNKLRFSLELHPRPFDISDARLDAWGRLTITILMPGTQVVLVEWEWTLDDVAQWFAEHQHALCSEQFPTLLNIEPVAPGESLAQAEDRCYRTSEFLEGHELESWCDTVREPLREYRERHMLTRALPGARVPPIFIGCNHGKGEISLSVEEGENEDGAGWESKYNGTWSYAFDMEDFIHSLSKEITRFLNDWSIRTSDIDAIRRTHDIIVQLDQNLSDCCR